MIYRAQHIETWADSIRLVLRSQLRRNHARSWVVTLLIFIKMKDEILIEVIEPGSQGRQVNLVLIMNEAGRVSVGRSLNEHNHIALEDAPSVVSRRQCTIEVRGVGLDLALWVRDGGESEKGWAPSRNKSYISDRGSAWKELPDDEWVEFLVGDVLRFCRPAGVEAGGYMIRFPIATTKKTQSSLPCEGEALGLWLGASQVSDDGVLLLRPISEGILVVKADSTAEFVFGYQPGELLASEGSQLIGAMVDDSVEVREQAAMSLAQNPPTHRAYSSGEINVIITMSRRYVDGDYLLLAWVRRSAEIRSELRGKQHWSAKVADVALAFLESSPLLFAIAVVVVAIAVVILAL